MNSQNNSARKMEQRRRWASVELERKWRRILGQWRASGLDGRDFIRARGLPEASFYGWKRTLRLRDAEAARAAKRVRAKKRLSQQTPRVASPASKPDKRLTLPRKDAALPAFVPVSVTPPPLHVPIELSLANGRTLRVPPGFDEATLTRLLCVLERP